MEKDVNQEIPDTIQYAGFWVRSGASLIDSILLMFLTIPLMFMIYGDVMLEPSSSLVLGGWDVVINWVFPAVAIIIFWRFRGATPGKIILDLKVVDAKTGLAPNIKQSVIRYLCYFVSAAPLCLGFLWIAFDKKKQGWHDKLADTVVIRVWK